MSDTPTEEKLPSLHLRRESLSDLPPVTLPGGYALRTASASDLPALTDVLASSFPEMTWDETRTRDALFADETVKRVLAIADSTTDAIVATASARLLPETYPGAGYVHWVGASPEHRGKRLGYLVSLAVLHEFVAQGCESAVLDTDDFRIPAIKVYAALGFVPEFTHESHAPRWSKLREFVNW